MPTAVSEVAVRLTVPAAGVNVSQVPPAGTVAAAAFHFNAWEQAPLALILMGCVAGAGCPLIPWKLRADAGVEIVQGACTVNVTGNVCGLPTAGCPAPSVPLMLIEPLYVPGIKLDNRVAETLMD